MTQLHAIIGMESQAKSSDYHPCDYRSVRQRVGMATMGTTQREAIEIFDKLTAHGRSQRELADALGIEPNKVTKVRTGERLFKANEVLAAHDWFASLSVSADLPPQFEDRDYVRVEVLPSFAGMGGGGSGDGDPATGVIPRRLIEDELRARPSDLLLIDVRGESMMPDFLHGDQILIDKRDVNPRQPGAFALWDGDGYVVKLVERVPRKQGFYRVFSANNRYSAYEVEEGEITILGRPVWFARRL